MRNPTSIQQSLKIVGAINRAVLRSGKLYDLLNQVLIFRLCEEQLFLQSLGAGLEGPETGQKSVHTRYLYTLMFYNVLSYCAAYVGDLLVTRKQWALPCVTIAETSQVKHLGMTATKLTLEWTKLLISVVTLAFCVVSVMLATDGRNGADAIQSTWKYFALTFSYYLTSEKLIIDNLEIGLPRNGPHFLGRILLERFECKEHLLALFIMKLLALVLALGVHVGSILAVRPFGLLKMLVWSVSFYFTFYLRTEEMKQKIFQEFVNEELRTGSFPRMTKEQLKDHQDVCGICLEEMRWSGRKTPCNHVFHNHCLSLAISSFTFCPICKYPL